MNGDESYLDDLRDTLTCKKQGCYMDRRHILDDDEWKIETRLATEYEIDNHKILPRDALTLIGTKGLDNIRYCIKQALQDNVPGGFMETGVWRGGACIFAAGCFKHYGASDRPVYVCDSFEGLPLPVHPNDYGHEYYNRAEYFKVSLDTILNNFKRFNLLTDTVRTIKGYFEQTMPELQKEDITLSVLRLDGDMYSSTISVLEAMYDKVSPGGFIIIDDYPLDTCRKALFKFRDERNITTPMIAVTEYENNGPQPAIVYWRKSL